MGAKEKWQPYLGDLCIHVIIWVRYHTHTHTHTHTHPRACALNTKTNKIKKVRGCQSEKNQRKARLIMVLKYFTIFSSF